MNLDLPLTPYYARLPRNDGGSVVPVRNGQAYGRGAYTATDAHVSTGYGSALLLCAVKPDSDVKRVGNFMVVQNEEKVNQEFRDLSRGWLSGCSVPVFARCG